MICVTGAAGFIGSNLVKYLNDQNIQNIILIDYFDKNKNYNIKDLKYSKRIDLNKNKFFNLESLKNIEVLIHLGAITDTLCKDINLLHKNNYLFSKNCYEFCKKNRIKFIYASSAAVYGKNSTFIEKSKYEAPINLYAYSKKLFDDFVRDNTLNFTENNFPIYGLRFFNVYGINEFHKNNMSSPVYAFYKQATKEKEIKLFHGSGKLNYKKISRDFIYVQDISEIIHKLIKMNKSNSSGIFNIGTGNNDTFYKIALTVKKYFNSKKNSKISIKKIPFPSELLNGYQSYTKANTSKIKKLLNIKSFTKIEDGIFQYLSLLK